jgi:hypothetical protein
VRKLEKQAEEDEKEDEDDEDDDDEDDDDEMVIHPDRVASTGPLPSADSLIRSVEELLRQQRQQQQQDFDEDEDN